MAVQFLDAGHGADVDEVSMAAWDMADMGKVLSSVALVILRSRRRRQDHVSSLSHHSHAVPPSASP